MGLHQSRRRSVRSSASRGWVRIHRTASLPRPRQQQRRQSTRQDWSPPRQSFAHPGECRLILCVNRKQLMRRTEAEKSSPRPTTRSSAGDSDRLRSCSFLLSVLRSFVPFVLFIFFPSCNFIRHHSIPSLHCVCMSEASVCLRERADRETNDATETAFHELLRRCDENSYYISIHRTPISTTQFSRSHVSSFNSTSNRPPSRFPKETSASSPTETAIVEPE